MAELSLAAQVALSQVTDSGLAESERRKLAAQALKRGGAGFASDKVFHAAVMSVVNELDPASGDCDG